MKFLTTVAALGTLTVLLGAPSGAAEPADFTYVGSRNCKKCHLKEWKSWSKTSMAQTFDVLKPGVRTDEKISAGLDPNKDYSTSPDCVRCHVTGFGKPGGFIDIETTPDLVGVGCETCHGPGGTYTEDRYMSLKNRNFKKAEVIAVGMVGEVSRAQCLSCHNPDSPFVNDGFIFDFDSNKEKGTHDKFPLKYSH